LAALTSRRSEELHQTRRLKLIVSYDGSEFAGWQSQRHGNTIQDAIERSLSTISGYQVVLAGAGRTDAGVHALGQCAHADVAAGKLDAGEWLKALNATLPPAIRILRARLTGGEFHARFSARAKLYRYRISTDAVLSPFENGRAWHITRPLEFAVLSDAAALFVGRHDFAAFSAKRGKPEPNTVRSIESVRVRRRGQLISLEFCGDGFLYKMVRMMVGALVRHASGKGPRDAIQERLEHPTRQGAAFVAPAHGLYLVSVRY